MPKALILIANSISGFMAQAALELDGIDYSDVAVIPCRKFEQDWIQKCGVHIQYNKSASLKFSGQFQTVGFYKSAARILKEVLADKNLTHIYISNSENIMFSHALQHAERNRRINLTVLCDGNMNYQPILPRNRAWWRWMIKPVAAAVYGLDYRKPKTHLSGSFEPRVDSVLTYSALHMQAPIEKIVEAKFKPVEVKVPPDPKSILVIATALNQFMSHSDYEKFKFALARWIDTLGASKIYIKLHPNYDTAGIEKAINGAEVFQDSRSIELIADQIPAQTVIGYWTNALTTLKNLRPDLQCIDFGSDFYAGAAYPGDETIPKVLLSSKVDIVYAKEFLN